MLTCCCCLYPSWCCLAHICPHHRVWGLQSKQNQKQNTDQPSKPERRNRAAIRRASPRAARLQGIGLASWAAAFLMQGVRVLLRVCLALHLCFTCGLCSWVSWLMNVVLFVPQQTKRYLRGQSPQRCSPCSLHSLLQASGKTITSEPGFISEGICFI